MTTLAIFATIFKANKNFVRFKAIT